MEIRLAARRDGYDADIIESVLEEFQERRWLSDERFAEAFTRNKLTVSRWAPGKIVQGLRAKGVDSGLAERTVRSLAPSDPDEAIEAEVVKKRRHFLRIPDERQRKKKIVEYLLRKGYDPEPVFRSADRLALLVTE